MEVPRLRVESELQLLAYTAATAMWDLSCVCNLQHGNARSLTRVLMDTIRVLYCRATVGTPHLPKFNPRRKQPLLVTVLNISLEHKN